LTFTSWKYNAEIIADKMIEIEVANPFRTLSAYFTTTATNYRRKRERERLAS
jgi:hypothetical protein